MAESQLAYQHQKRTMILFCICYALSVIPLTGNIDLPVIVLSLLCIGYRYGEIINRFREHPKKAEKAVIILVILAIILSVARHGIRAHLVSAFIDLLVSGIALKFLEQTRQRDLVAQVLALLFLSAVPFIFHFEWYMLLYLLVLVFFSFCALMSLFARQSMGHLFRYCARLIAMAVPLGALAFLVLPRFNPFWQMPGNPAASTGLGEEVDFNSISRLIEDQSVAFRAKFDGAIPRERYFTATYYPQFDPVRNGFIISGDMVRFEYHLNIYSRQSPRERHRRHMGTGTEYHLFVEPSQKRWIPALENSVSDDDQIFLTPMGTWIDRMPITQPRYYRFRHQTLPSDQEYLRRIRAGTDLQYLLNTGFYRQNPRTREFVSQLVKETGSPREFIMRIMSYFRQENFRYTLSPVSFSTERRNLIDAFLFENRNGFCNHYSAATAYMLRLAGIPAMVAGGYLGGTVNTEENYVTLRNSDAHSWVVAALDGHWVRIDPVTFIAPERVEKSYLDMISPSSMPVMSMERYRNHPVVGWLRKTLDELEFRWNSMILNYNFSDEQGFIQRFFTENALAAVATLAGALMGIFCLTLLFSGLLGRKKLRSPAAECYLTAIAELAPLGIRRLPMETPEMFLRRVLPTLASEELRQALADLTAAYNSAVYQGALAEKEGRSMLRRARKALIRACSRERRRRRASGIHGNLRV